jgi:hypothetical protein
MRHALVPDLLLHSQQRMFWTRCCTTCHITSQLFQALYSNIKTSKTQKKPVPEWCEFSLGTCDAARIGT